MSEIVGVLLPLPFNDVFDYKVESDNVVLGSIVRVPWGREQQVGVVWKLGKSADIPESKIKPIIEVLRLPPLSDALRKFVSFVSFASRSPLINKTI